MKYRISFIMVVLFILPLSLFAHSNEDSGYNIHVQLEGIQNADLYLGFHYGNKQFIKDTIRLNENGKGTFTGDEPLKQGIYLIITPSKKYFEILIGEDQHVSLKSNVNDFVYTLEFQNSRMNEVFNE